MSNMLEDKREILFASFMKILKDLISKELVFIIMIFLIDRLTKIYVITKFDNNLSLNLFESKYLNFHLIWNDGIAFGLLSSSNDFFYNVITFIIFLIIIVLIRMLINSTKLEKIALIFVIGGACGNFLDRIIYKSVPDFIDLHYNNFHWFVFNVADIFVTVGVILLIFNEIFYEKKI
jgi:signal peptidase II